MASASRPHDGFATISAVHCVIARTNTRSKKSSSGLTRSPSRIDGVRRVLCAASFTAREVIWLPMVDTRAGRTYHRTYSPFANTEIGDGCPARRAVASGPSPPERSARLRPTRLPGHREAARPGASRSGEEGCPGTAARPGQEGRQGAVAGSGEEGREGRGAGPDDERGQGAAARSGEEGRWRAAAGPGEEGRRRGAGRPGEHAQRCSGARAGEEVLRSRRPPRRARSRRRPA